jgi:hypothetical protein
MRRSALRLRVPGILAGLAVVAVACGGSSATSRPIVAATPGATATATATLVPTPESTASPDRTAEPPPGVIASQEANTFVSPRYGYALTLPPHVALLGWHGADRQWDGQSKVHIAGPYTDRTVVAEGGLLVIGSEAESLDEFVRRFEATGPRFRGCGMAQNRLDVTIGGVPAIGFTQICGDDAHDGFGRVALFNNGWGIGASIATTFGNEVAGRDRLIELLEGLEWRPE